MSYLNEIKGLNGIMIVLKNVEDVVKCTLQGQKLLDTLKKLNLNVIEFFKFVENDELASKLFAQSRIAQVQIGVDDLIHTIDKASTPFELDKAIAKSRVNQWLAEKLIPKIYGNRIDVNQNVTIDIRAVLASANARVDAIDHVRATAIELPINRGKTIDKIVDESDNTPPVCGADLIGDMDDA